MLPRSAPTPLLCFLGSAKFARVQRQKPAMFTQMPLCVYRHFTGAVCTTSSDGRFALFSAPSTAVFSLASRLSNSSDIRLPGIFRAPHCSAVAGCAHQVQRCRGLWGNGLDEQIFGADKQISGCGYTPRRMKMGALVIGVYIAIGVGLYKVRGEIGPLIWALAMGGLLLLALVLA